MVPIIICVNYGVQMNDVTETSLYSIKNSIAWYGMGGGGGEMGARS